MTSNTKSPKPLNQTLYKLLRVRFGDVRIANAGEALLSRIGYDPIEDRNFLDVQHPGEYYVVNCPYCGDSSKRLYINHMWGTQDDQLGGRRLQLAICFNEECLRGDWDRRIDLFDQVTELPGVLEKAKILEGETIDLANVKMEWPGPVTRLDKLPKSHPACDYVRSRGFDPETLGRLYDVRYCHDSDRWLARKRLIIPLYDAGELKGWQARHLGDEIPKASDGRKLPKYYTAPGTPRRMLIYNYDNAVKYRTGVLMEGPTDPWSLGLMGMASLGSKLTSDQIKKLKRGFRRHSLVWLPDPDVFEDPKEEKNLRVVERELRQQFDGGFAIVQLPVGGPDPGAMDRGFLRDYIRQEAAKQGCKVSWKRRPKSERKNTTRRRRRLATKGN